MLLHHKKGTMHAGRNIFGRNTDNNKRNSLLGKKYQSFKVLSSLCWTQKGTSVKSLSPSNHTSTRTLPVAWIRQLGSEMLNISFVKDKGNPAVSKNSEALLRAALPIQNWNTTYVTCGRGFWNYPYCRRRERKRKGRRDREIKKIKERKKQTSWPLKVGLWD